ncbi:MAG: hypothetical protein GY793_07425 [Proteobacteria bacterium]|nr:hypothetical protein [Pseudomonadota bacterium]
MSIEQPKLHKVFIVAHSLCYPCQKNLKVSNSFGFLLGILLVIQTTTGILLLTSYSTTKPFTVTNAIINNDTINGANLRVTHIIGSSLIMLCLFLHLARTNTSGFGIKSNTASLIAGAVL